MKRFLIIASLVLTLCNVGAGVAYACSCYENGVLACKTDGPGHCYKDAGGRCHCKDAIIIIEEPAPGEEGEAEN